MDKLIFGLKLSIMLLRAAPEKVWKQIFNEPLPITTSRRFMGRFLADNAAGWRRQDESRG